MAHFLVSFYQWGVLTAAVLLLLLLCSSCYDAPDYITVHGYEVWDEHGLSDQAEVEAHTEFMYSYLPAQLRDDMRGLWVVFRAEPMAANGRSYAGLAWEDRIMVHLDPAVCFSATAFIHELLHVASWRLYGDPDRAHVWVQPWVRQMRADLGRRWCDD